MCSCFSALSCSDVGVIIILSLIAIPSMSSILSLNNQYSSISLCTSALVDGHVWSIGSANALRCSSSRVTILMSAAVMQSCMSIYDSIALFVMQMPNISSSLFVVWLCLESQIVMNSCGPDLYSILMLY